MKINHVNYVILSTIKKEFLILYSIPKYKGKKTVILWGETKIIKII